MLKRITICVLAVSAMLSLGSAQTSKTVAPGIKIRVLSYNIKHCQGMDGKVDVARTAAVVRSVKPDIVALQEVDVNVGRSGRVNEAVELGRLTGMRAIFGPTIDLDGGKYGNAVLTRLPVKMWSNHALPGIEPRALLDVDLGTFQFFATHLDVGRDDARRRASIPEINSLAAGPAILAGDLNSTPDSATLRVLKTEWSVVGQGKSLLTIPSGTPRRQIDFVLFRPAHRWHVAEVRVLNERVASDHRPIFAVLELK